MANPVLMPKQGITVESCILTKWNVKVGDKVTIATDGIRVTATTASGVAKIVEFAKGTKATGDTVLIKFD